MELIGMENLLPQKDDKSCGTVSVLSAGVR